MSPQIYFAIIIAFLGICVIIFDQKFNMLRDLSTANKKPYSFSRVQLAWWTVIVLSSFVTILIGYGDAPELNSSTLILLGISAATMATAKVIDLSDRTNPKIAPASISQNSPSEGFFRDILSDENGVSIHRFQTVVFNLVFGIWFLLQVANNIHDLNILDWQEIVSKDLVMPVVSDNNLILLGLSSGTYAALKATENKPKQSLATDKI